MRKGEDEERDYRIGRLSYFQTGIVFLLIATAIYIYVAYQIMEGRVYTKSGDMQLAPGFPWAWLTLESFGATVGVVRGIKMIQRRM